MASVAVELLDSLDFAAGDLDSSCDGIMSGILQAGVRREPRIEDSGSRRYVRERMPVVVFGVSTRFWLALRLAPIFFPGCRRVSLNGNKGGG